MRPFGVFTVMHVVSRVGRGGNTVLPMMVTATSSFKPSVETTYIISLYLLNRLIKSDCGQSGVLSSSIVYFIYSVLND
jgi:hypothetical protein